MHEAHNQSDDDINCFLLSRATTGTNFDFIPHVGVEITGRERVRTVCGSRDYRERQDGDRMWESRLQGETGRGPYVGVEITERDRVGLYIRFRICKLCM